MNYTNPMSALTLLALRATRLRVVGLCHSVQGTSQQLADYLELPYAELRWRCAGINHLAWFTELTHKGRDMYPRLRERVEDPESTTQTRCREGTRTYDRLIPCRRRRSIAVVKKPL